MDVPFWAWAAVLAVILAMLAVDLFVLHRKPHAIQFKEALIGALIPISTAFLFMGVLYFAYNAHVLDAVLRHVAPALGWR